MIANPKQPVALTIAGSDSSGGAGIQADLKTFAALGVHGASAITAVTAQNTKHVAAVELLPPDFVAQQIKVVAEGAHVSAVKTGMLGTGKIVNAVVGALEDLSPHVLIVDPVMVATSGAPLFDDNGVDTLKRKLLPLAALVTPNLAEAAALLDTPEAQDRAEMERQARALSDSLHTAVLIKGGHLDADRTTQEMAADVLAKNGTLTWFEEPFVANADSHGTGCTLSAAITAECAKGMGLEVAVSVAKSYLTSALKASLAT